MDLITPEFGLVFWQTITLLVVLLILSKFAWKPILNVIREREHNIEAALQSAEQARQLLTQVQADKEALLKNASLESEKIIVEAMVAKNAIIEEAKLEAEEASKKAIAQTSALIRKEQEVALATLKGQVSGLAIQIAEKLLQRELQQRKTQEELVRRLIKEAH